MKTNFAYSDIADELCRGCRPASHPGAHLNKGGKKMEKFKVFGVDSNSGYFESVFDDKNRAYGFYMHRLENADFIEIIAIK